MHNLETMDSQIREPIRSFAEQMEQMQVQTALFDEDGRALFPEEPMPAGMQKCWETLRVLLEEQPQDSYVLSPVAAAGRLSAGTPLWLLLRSSDPDAADPPPIGSDRYLAEQIAPPTSKGTYLQYILTHFLDRLEAGKKFQGQIDSVGGELVQAYEELALLYNLSTNMRVNQSIPTYLQMACDQVTQLVNVEGIAVLLSAGEEAEKRYVLTAGSGLVTLDSDMADVLEGRLREELKEGKDALLDSQLDAPFKYTWPESIRNIIAVPLQGNDKFFGILVATNRIDKGDFDSCDAKLFNSVANQCAVFIQNDQLVGDLKELLIGSLKALTNSIDAKDQYTRGHSERVAFISRWIAERYAEEHPLSEDQIHRIYLAGLLHDIGKIGVNEAVLLKRGKLTEEEMEQIKAHPRIGAAILGDIKQMRDIVPGVLYHHERPDQQGYPDGLADEDTPLVAKIINLADAFDAMTSKRTYREAMSIRRAIREMEKGLGSQFDEEIGRIFIRSDINKLWNIIHDGFIESWDYSNFSEYGALAVGSLLRSG